IRAIVVLQRELLTAGEMPASAAALTDDAWGGLFLEPYTRERIAVTPGTVFSRVLIDFVCLLTIDRDRETRALGLVVVICLRPCSGSELFLVMPLRDDVLILDGVSAKVIARRFLLGAWLVSGGIIRQNHHVFAVVMFTEVVNAFFLHEARSEI